MGRSGWLEHGTTVAVLHPNGMVGHGYVHRMVEGSKLLVQLRTMYRQTSQGERVFSVNSAAFHEWLVPRDDVLPTTSSRVRRPNHSGLMVRVHESDFEIRLMIEIMNSNKKKAAAAPAVVESPHGPTPPISTVPVPPIPCQVVAVRPEQVSQVRVAQKDAASGPGGVAPGCAAAAGHVSTRTAGKRNAATMTEAWEEPASVAQPAAAMEPEPWRADLANFCEAPCVEIQRDQQSDVRICRRQLVFPGAYVMLPGSGANADATPAECAQGLVMTAEDMEKFDVLLVSTIEYSVHCMWRQPELPDLQVVRCIVAAFKMLDMCVW